MEVWHIESFHHLRGPIQLIVADSVECSGTYWDGSSRSEYSLIYLQSCVLDSIPGLPSAPAPYDDRPAPVLPLGNGRGVLQISHFGGKRYTKIWVSREDLRFFRIKGADSFLSDDEALALDVTARLKSSYRADEYERLSRNLPRRTSWVGIRAQLADRGLMKRGAITMEGRNALQNYRNEKEAA